MLIHMGEDPLLTAGIATANFLEYVLGGNPRVASSGILPAATASSGNLVFTFRRIHSTTADTTQVFQYDTDLSGWTDVPVVAGVVGNVTVAI